MARPLLYPSETWTVYGYMGTHAPAVLDHRGHVLDADKGRQVPPGVGLMVPVTSATNSPGHVRGSVGPDGRLLTPPLGPGVVLDVVTLADPEEAEPCPCLASGVLCDACAAEEVPRS